ncbi:MAG: hypothetical protein A2176_00300 [Spirochaetes bacterium RBG_13_51_14]|nr:MAG: hypothetical protein A2176_00300 [Spirochaetes bacterium RBG_13_51_14]
MSRELLAPGMSCNHCKMTIEKAVKELSGIMYINADPDSKKVTVEFDDKSVTIDDIKNSIQNAGYTVEG